MIFLLIECRFGKWVGVDVDVDVDVDVGVGVGVGVYIGDSVHKRTNRGRETEK